MANEVGHYMSLLRESTVLVEFTISKAIPAINSPTPIETIRTILILRAAITSGEIPMYALLAVLALGLPLLLVIRRQLRPSRDSQWSATVSRS